VWESLFGLWSNHFTVFDPNVLILKRDNLIKWPLPMTYLNYPTPLYCRMQNLIEVLIGYHVYALLSSHLVFYSVGIFRHMAYIKIEHTLNWTFCLRVMR
jgi:hypothetical protein